MEYLKPLLLLVAGLPLAVAQVVFDADGAVGRATMGYLASFGLSVLLAMAGLVIAVRLFLGDAGPLGLAVLRVAGASAASDAAYLLLAPGAGLFTGPGVAAILVFVGLVVWLFDMDLTEAALLGAIICVLRLLGLVAFYFWGAELFR